jgi:hypothetical protein
MRSPERVIPYRSQEQLEQSEPEETEDGEEESEREEREEPAEEGGSESYSSSSMEASEKREVISATVVALRVPYSVSRMSLVACGEIGFGDTIWETESGRPFGMVLETEVSRRASRREEEECLELEEDLEDLEEDDLEDLLEEDGTSRMFRTRPVVGSVVEAWAGSWETWYPSMM